MLTEAAIKARIRGWFGDCAKVEVTPAETRVTFNVLGSVSCYPGKREEDYMAELDGLCVQMLNTVNYSAVHNHWTSMPHEQTWKQRLDALEAEIKEMRRWAK